MGHLFHCCWFGLQVKKLIQKGRRELWRIQFNRFNRQSKRYTKRGRTGPLVPCPAPYIVPRVSAIIARMDGWMDVELAINCSSVCPHLCLANVSVSQGWAGGITNMSSWAEDWGGKGPDPWLCPFQFCHCRCCLSLCFAIICAPFSFDCRVFHSGEFQDRPLQCSSSSSLVRGIFYGGRGTVCSVMGMETNRKRDNING